MSNPSPRFPFDVFLSHSANDKAVVRGLAERLRNDGLSVWFDEWVLGPDDDTLARIEEALEQSRVLVLCLSRNALGSDRAQLEAGTFRFRDPLNKERRFVPLRLDDAPVEGSLAQFLSIDWIGPNRETEYPKLVEACRRQAGEPTPEQQATRDRLLKKIFSIGHTASILSVAWSPDGERALSGSADKTVRLWEVESGRCLNVLEGHIARVRSVAWSPDGERALSGSDDNTLRLWEVESGRCLNVLEGHMASVLSVAWSPDGERALSASVDNTVRLWEVESGRCLSVLEGHTSRVLSVAWSPDGERALSGSSDKTVRLWEVKAGRCLRLLEGHTDSVWSVVWSPDGERALSGSHDATLRLWEVESGRCLSVLEGHTSRVLSVAWSPDGECALSGSEDKTVRLWEVESGRCLNVLEGHSARVLSVAWSPDGERALSGSSDKTVRLWEVKAGRCLRLLEGHTDSVWSVVWSPDGERALSGSHDATLRLWEVESGRCRRVLEGHTSRVWSVAWSPDGERALSGSHDATLRLWEVESGRCLRVLEGHTADVRSVAWSPGERALSGSDDKTVRLWEVESESCLRVLEGHTDSVRSVAWSPDGERALSGSYDSTVRLWEVMSGRCLRVLEGHTARVLSVVWSPDGERALSGSDDNTVRLWEVMSGRCLRVLEGHTNSVWSVTWSPNGERALSGSEDKTVRLWEVDSGRCLRVLEGHTASVRSVAWSPDGERALSGSEDKTVRVWEVESGRCLRVLKGHTASVRSVAWSPDGERALSGSMNGGGRVWDLSTVVREPRPRETSTYQVRYTNAKVLLVGESGVGKTGLSNYLAHGVEVEDAKALASTDGAWSTHWPLLPDKQAGIEREIWLWDFAGQVDYRLVHQLFMDDAAVAVLVFNPQLENPFDGLGHWDRDLRKAARRPFAKLLAAARIDRGGLVVSKVALKKFMQDRGFREPLLETSAKTGEGCDHLREAIVQAIDWERIPETTSPALYHRMKQEILSLRDRNIVLMRLGELKQRMEMTLQGEHFEPRELETVVSLLAGPGMIQNLDFGGFVLLRPEVLSRYAAAAIRKVRKHPRELGCIREDDLLAGALDYQDFERLPPEDERVVLRTLVETFVSRAWCLRQTGDGSALLTFPSYFRRERTEQPSHPNVLVTYRFEGPADEIYATLVVRLHHTTAFASTDLWKSAADFQTQTGQKLGFTMKRESEGTTLLEVYFDREVDENSRVLFLRYVHDHLTQHAKDVARLRHYCCANKKCKDFERPFKDREAIDEALAADGGRKVFCGKCGKPIPLRDVIEEKFESPAVKQQVREMQGEVDAVLDNESRELILVGHAYSIVAEAGQIYRGYTNSDHGIDGEIEFKGHQGGASGKRLYLQLKSGDSYLKRRKGDGAEVFTIKNPRWVNYWRQQAYPVMLVIRTSDGVIRWMNVSARLQKESAKGKPVRQIVFDGERFDAVSVQRWRERALSRAF